MRVLCVNCGSSTLKFDLLDLTKAQEAQTRVASGLIERIGGESNLTLSVAGLRTVERQLAISDHGQAMEEALSRLDEHGLLSGVEAVGHRIVHGGRRFRSAVLIDDDIIEAIDAVSDLAPLHNRPALEAIKTARASIGHSMTMIATFDTAFYAELPKVASVYAIPLELSEKYAIRRYGFHGLAHRYMVQRFRELRPQVQRPRLITLQLGNGCSATASSDGRPVDTSMGFTPLEGLIMGTRSGDLDPSLPLFLGEKEGLSPAEVASLLNTRSGLLGLSGRSSDMRDILAASAAGDASSALAIDAFCYRVKKYVGAYIAALGGADAIVFGGGIGENSAEIRQRVCAGMESAGVLLDLTRNTAASGQDARVSDDNAAVEVWVVRVDETEELARDVVDWAMR